MSALRRRLLLLCAASCCVFARPAAAQDRAEPDAEALGTHQRHLRLELGARAQLVSDAGLDPFSTNDVLPAVTLGASHAFFTRERLSLAALLAFDYGVTSALARSNEASLHVMRFSLGPEARYHVLRVLAVTAKLAPTLARQSAEISTGAGSDLKKVAWKPGFDATLGAALELFGYHSGASRKPRLWLTGEGGYGWTAPTQMSFRPDGPAPQRLQPLELADLSLSGPLFRATAGISFW